MVVLQVKNGDHDGFLYETTCATLNDDLVRDLVRVWNTRIRLAQLCGGLMDLAEHGPMKHPNKAGIDEIQEKYNDETIEKGEFYKPDPTGVRNGNGVGPHLMETFERVVRDIQSVLDKVISKCFETNSRQFCDYPNSVKLQNNVTRKIPISLAILQEKLDLARGAVTMGMSIAISGHDWSC